MTASTAPHIAPLFWHHGEEPEIILREIDAMHSSGIREFILEPRPHPDYLGERWWSDVEVVLEAARERDMRVWFFDDARFPSGWLNGILRTEHREMRKHYLSEEHVDTQGPARGTSFALRPWLRDGDRLHAVVAARRSGDDGIESTSLVDLTHEVVDDILYWDVPEGRWRISVIVDTERGQEAETADYLNPIAAGAAQLHLATVHGPHFDRFGADFGGLVAGFFQDEPRFGNAKSYEFRLGEHRERVWGTEYGQVLPFSELLADRLDVRWGPDARRLLPLLWWSGDDELTARTRYSFMDEVTRLYESFQRELGDWCEAHGVDFIGHVVEDNGAHARLGYGAGHYFRALAGQHMGGIDVVQHVRPGATTGRRAGSFGEYDDDFFFWGLAKLASSAAHIDPRKQGLAMCEAFGAYGWHEGLRLMKWITDHLLVRGINVIVPHAFSARTWDPDCPPHFFNGGLNPQWRHFPLWRAYAEGLADALSGGIHLSDAAVLYHAEAEWAGEHQPFERVMAALLTCQRDADVVPIDAVLTSEVVAGGGVRIGSEDYPLLIVPYAERLPRTFVEFVVDSGARVVFIDALPHALADDEDQALLDRLAAAVDVVPLSRIGSHVDGPVQTSDAEPALRVLRYAKNGATTVFLVNESPHASVDTVLTVPDQPGDALLLDPVTGTRRRAVASREDGTIGVRLRLAPGESRLLEFVSEPGDAEHEPEWSTTRHLSNDGWTVSVRAFDAGSFETAHFGALGPVNVPTRLPGFAGTIRYERQVDLSGVDALNLGQVGEVAEVSFDGASLGVRFAEPYRFELAPEVGEGTLTIDVTTTLAPLLAGDNPFDAAVALDPTGLLGPLHAERRAP